MSRLPAKIERAPPFADRKERRENPGAPILPLARIGNYDIRIYFTSSLSFGGLPYIITPTR
jgi:hypothetical protein